MKIEITVPGEPKPQKRHRTFHKGKITGSYDPSSDVKDDFLITCMNHRPEKPIDLPINMELKFYSSRPKSHYGTGSKANVLKSTAPYFKTSKPDIDNLQKFVMDSLNSIFYRDDSLICLLSSVKLYDEIPRIEIMIETL